MTVVMNNSRIDSLAHNRDVVAQFPFLKKLKGREPNCCLRTGPKQLDYDFIKVAITQMPAVRQRAFKELFGGQEIVVVIPGGERIII